MQNLKQLEATGLKELDRDISSPGLAPKRGQEYGKGSARGSSPGWPALGPHSVQFPFSLKSSLPSPVNLSWEVTEK